MFRCIYMAGTCMRALRLDIAFYSFYQLGGDAMQNCIYMGYLSETEGHTFEYSQFTT